MMNKASICISESYPSSEPRAFLFAKPELFTEDNRLTLTPEKSSSNGIEKYYIKQPSVAKRKVTFKENKLKDMSSDAASELSCPSINSTHSLEDEIVRTRNKKFDLSQQVLKETVEYSQMQNVMNQDVCSALNYKLTDKKYKNLTSIDVEANDVAVAKPKSLYREKVKDLNTKPDVMDLWFPNEMVIEKYYFESNEFQSSLEETDSKEEETDNYDFLLDMYECNAFLPSDNFHL